MRNCDIEVGNGWVFPYSPLLSKIYKTDVKVDYCNFFKSIRYIRMYVNKGQNITLFG